MENEGENNLTFHSYDKVYNWLWSSFRTSWIASFETPSILSYDECKAVNKKIQTMSRKVAVITGSNAGIGLTLAERLLSTHSNLHICLACRNKIRAQSARDALRVAHPGAEVSIVIVDTSNVLSVLQAAKEIRTRFSRIDYLYLNAGKMAVTNIDYAHFIKGLIKRNALFMLHTGKGILIHSDSQTSEGLQDMFATNVFGHFVMVRELEDLLGGEDYSQVIWTSSIAAVKSSFSQEDIQHKNGNDPYGSSKCLMDATSLALNERFNKKGVYSHSTCPGFVITSMTNGILDSWIWFIFLPIIWLLRLLLDHFNVNTYRGSEALVWLSTQKPERIDPSTRYHSCTSFLGKSYINPVKIDFSAEEVDSVYKELNQMYLDFKTRYKNSVPE